MGKKEERGAESWWGPAMGPDRGSASWGSPLRPLLLRLLLRPLRGLPGEARVRPGGKRGGGKGEGMRPSPGAASYTSVTVYPTMGRLPCHSMERHSGQVRVSPPPSSSPLLGGVVILRGGRGGSPRLLPPMASALIPSCQAFSGGRVTIRLGGPGWSVQEPACRVSCLRRHTLRLP